MNLLVPLLPARQALAALLAGISLIACGAALAGECPREHVLTTPRAVQEKPDIGVARPTLTVVHLKDWRGVGDLYLRMRQLTIAVDGIVPTDPHDDRPSIVYVATNSSNTARSAPCPSSTARASGAPSSAPATSIGGRTGPAGRSW